MENKKDMIGAFSVEQFKNQMRVYNANEALTNPGFEFQIDSTTQVIQKVLQTNYYELNGQKLSDFVPIETGMGTFSTDIVQLATKAQGTDFKSCLINPTTGGFNLDGHTDIEIGEEKYPNNFFRDTYSVSREGVEIARRNVIPLDIVSEKERARKKKFDLGLQDAWFNGLGDGKSYGLLNQPSATINTSYMGGKTIAQMSDAEFQTFAAGLRGAYDNLTNSTANFDRLVLPQADYFALDKVFGQYGMTRRQILEDIVKANNGKILYTRYNTTAGTGGVARYALYKYDPDYIEGYIPLEYTPYPLFPTNSLDMMSQCMAQFVTPQVKRTNTLLYLDAVA